MSVKLIINDEEIIVNRTILIQFDYFKDLLEIESDNITINYVDVKLFKILIWMLEQNTDIVRDVAILADFLGHEGGCKSLIEYKCNIINCNNMAFDKTYCKLHLCTADGCKLGGLMKYCTIHRCVHDGCMNIKSAGTYSSFCISHKCVVENCSGEKFLDYNFCRHHKCSEDECPKMYSKSKYCITHACASKGCLNGGKTKYCYFHICKSGDCNNEKLKDCNYCVVHKCAFRKCKMLIVTFCSIHNINRNRCPQDCFFKCYVCEKHKCIMGDCSNGKSSGYDVCGSHLFIQKIDI